MSQSKQITKFAIAGKLLRFTLKGDAQIKQIELQTYKGNIWIKISKKLRPILIKIVSVGDTVLVEGEKHFNSKKGRIQLKARVVTVKEPKKATPLESDYSIGFEATKPLNSLLDYSHDPLTTAKSQPSAAKILVCQKSDCQKRGSQSICRLLEETLRDRGLHEQITIKKVGCIKHCKSGPHIVLMPDKTRYSELKPSRIPELIERHFPAAKLCQSA